MGTYIILTNYTEKGISSMKESPKRLDSARKLGKSLGVKLRDFYLCLGSHDAVAIAEAKDDESMAKFVLALASRGNVRTTTLRAFTEEQYRGITAGLP